MTRINLVDVTTMADQHLMAEYRELPRIVNEWKVKCNNIKFYQGIPNKFCLGTGHVRFFRNKIRFLIQRYSLIVQELIKRNFKLQQQDMRDSVITNLLAIDEHQVDWFPTKEDIKISQARINEKLRQRPTFYRYYGKLIIRKT